MSTEWFIERGSVHPRQCGTYDTTSPEPFRSVLFAAKLRFRVSYSDSGSDALEGMYVADEKEIELKPTLNLTSRFGVGCAQFVPKDVNRSFTNFDQYVEELERSLESIAAIHELNLPSSSDLGNFQDELPIPFPELSDGEFPFIAQQAGITLDISMRISIPTRTQKQLLDIDDDVNWDPFNQIRVYISHRYSCPIVLVEIGRESSSPPSTCVRLVREFLKLEMNNNNECSFALDLVGPTPFHADFSVYEKSEQREKFSFERVEQRGYVKINVYVKNSSSSSGTIEHSLRAELMDDFDVFYSIILDRNNINDEWFACFGKVREFEHKRKSWGVPRKILAFFIPPFSVYDSVSDISNFRLSNICVLSFQVILLSRKSDFGKHKATN
jgi:hypothetical protein